MRLNKKGENKHSVGKVVMKSVMKFLLANPPLLGIIVVVIIGFIAYTLYSIDYQLTQIMKQYQSLSARRDDSKEGFDKKLFYITVDDNGNTTITVGFSSEEQQAQAEKDLEDSGNDGGGNGQDPPPPPPKDLTPQEKEVWSALSAAGYNNTAIAGIMACIKHESGFNPGATNSSGYYGLCQWGGGRKDNLISWCKSNNHDPTTIKGQIQFAIYEADSNNCGVASLNNIQSVASSKDSTYTEGSLDDAVLAGVWWMMKFERCVVSGQTYTIANRFNAYQYYCRYVNGKYVPDAGKAEAFENDCRSYVR